MEIENLDHTLNLTSEKTQKKWEKCHGNPTGHEESLVLALRYVEIIIVQMCNNTKMIKQLTSNTSYFIVCEATCFGPYVTIIRPSYESSQ